ncbi:hypothetical protein Bind_3713 (plasmid) [Beijerinckia indica subsp. indica ATCC 9039]|uniref:Glycosyl-4,4'-diaponeurosporenoate acyltransferase n=1 Tax=Beijerinckia indica subsp. indica (strain ATCC 9039 / DSM 1715 / NCIMB 8712) TaxID=395963 RepID=B2IL65_BEII9|nr:hypothetical protein Bind_3713 [Beijerinckia indica subsp. indica ATCC 9039]
MNTLQTIYLIALSVFTLSFDEFLYRRYLHHRKTIVDSLVYGSDDIDPLETRLIKKLHNEVIYDQNHPLHLERIFKLSQFFFISFVIIGLIIIAFGFLIALIPFIAINYIVYSRYCSEVTNIPMRLRKRLQILTFIHPIK